MRSCVTTEILNSKLTITFNVKDKKYSRKKSFFPSFLFFLLKISTTIWPLIRSFKNSPIYLKSDFKKQKNKAKFYLIGCLSKMFWFKFLLL